MMYPLKKAIIQYIMLTLKSRNSRGPRLQATYFQELNTSKTKPAGKKYRQVLLYGAFS